VRPLDPAIVRVWTVLGLVAMVPFVVPGVVVLAVTGHALGWVLLGLVLIVGVVLAGVVPRLRYGRFRFGVADGVLHVHRGIVIRSESAVPVFRIQHIDLQQGPLDRWAGLQQLVVHTAAPAADVSLPGIATEEAAALRTRLLELSREAVARHGAGEVSDAV
jgi:uncharacterized protein